MSHRMCAKCKTVVDNIFYSEDYCPDCRSQEWADPNDHNDEWSLINKLQFSEEMNTLTIEQLRKELARAEKEIISRGENFNKLRDENIRLKEHITNLMNDDCNKCEYYKSDFKEILHLTKLREMRKIYKDL